MQFGSFTAVDHVDLTVGENEIHSIIGPNGAGKTTFFNLVTGAYSPTSGSIFFRGREITSQKEHDRAQNGILRSFQIAQYFPNLSIVDNLAIASHATHQSYNPLAEKDAELTERARSMFDELNIGADLQSAAENLAHGDKKKLEIGMTLLADPDLLLLDEPTSGVSEAESEWIIDFIQRRATDLTILLIEHDMEVVFGVADRITVLHQGSVIARGSPTDIQDDPAVQDAYLGGYEA